MILWFRLILWRPLISFGGLFFGCMGVRSRDNVWHLEDLLSTSPWQDMLNMLRRSNDWKKLRGAAKLLSLVFWLVGSTECFSMFFLQSFPFKNLEVLLKNPRKAPGLTVQQMNPISLGLFHGWVEKWSVLRWKTDGWSQTACSLPHDS